jgi:hypothetical protein
MKYTRPPVPAPVDAGEAVDVPEAAAGVELLLDDDEQAVAASARLATPTPISTRDLRTLDLSALLFRALAAARGDRSIGISL